MKLSISTLGCPDWDFLRVVKEFSALHCDIEVRGIDGEMDADKIVRFDAAHAAQTKAILQENGVKLIGFGTSCSFHDADKRAQNVEQAKNAVDVCVRMGIPAIRVFGNDIPDPSKMEETAACVCEGLKEVCAYAAPKGIGVNLEIHGDFNSFAAVSLLVEGMKGVAGFGILWDVEHSDKTCGDDFMPFYRLIQPVLKHVHIKDYHRAKGDKPFELCLVGQGDIPLKAILSQLEKDGYAGYLSFEWEKKWVPALPEPEVAFPAFAAYMQAL